MTATAATPAIEARERYLAGYRTFAGDSAGPVWWRELRERAIARFEAAGFPTTRQEEWRFTSVAPIVDAAFPFAGGETRAPTAERFVAAAAGRHAALLQAHVGRHAKIDANPLTALATAFLTDGVLVHVPAGTRADAPVVVTHAPRATETMTTPRLLVVVEAGAQATVVERFESGPVARHFTNAVAEIVLGEGAHCEYVRVQQESEQAYHVGAIHSYQARDSVLRSTSVTLGAALTRCDLGAVLDGPGALLHLNGLLVLSGEQHGDYHTVIDHAQPHCESHEFVNGVFDGSARGVFNGRIIVRPGAQRTDSKQTNNNLILSGDARADSQPQLEIYADDVKCTHGSTTGPIDQTALFYLRSRGLDAAAARAVLTYGFGADILGRIGTATVRGELDELIRSRLLADAQEAAA
ncbi:MAG TPA: Fe-S cluster assembly protein SufD [Gemmatimonadales bacterium]